MTDNTTILDAVYMEGSTDYQQRVPQASQAGVAAVSRFLFAPMNKKYLNEFMDILINRVGYTVVHNREFKNPLRKKRADLTYGSTIQEIALKFVQGHTYKDDWGSRKDDVINLLRVTRPDGEVAYHSINRQQTYEISVNHTELRTAFTTEYGLNELVIAIMQIPYNSAEYDEMRIYENLFAEHERYHGFYKYHLDNAVTDEQSGKAFLRALRTFAGKLRFPSSLYNALDVTDIPVWANEGERFILYVTPEVNASLDVDTLSGVFQLAKAEAPANYEIQIVDTIPIPNAVAILTTEDFWMCADWYIGTESFRNPQTITETFYLHVMGVYSTSPFVPAILFTTDAATTPATYTQTLTSLDTQAIKFATDDANWKSYQVIPGKADHMLVNTVTGTQTMSDGSTVPEVFQLVPDSATYGLRCVTNGTPAVPGTPEQPEVNSDYVYSVGTYGDTIPVGTVFNMEMVTPAGVQFTGSYTVTGDEADLAAILANIAAVNFGGYATVTATASESDTLFTVEYVSAAGYGGSTFTLTADVPDPDTLSVTLVSANQGSPYVPATPDIPGVPAGSVPLSVDTYIDRFGILHVEEGLPVGSQLTVDSTSTYTNPDGVTPALTDTLDFTVVSQYG